MLFRSHTHLKSDITDFPTSMPANGGNAATVGGHTVGVNVPSNAKFTDTTYSKLSEFTDDVGYVKNTDARLTDARPANGGTADKVSNILTIFGTNGTEDIAVKYDGSEQTSVNLMFETGNSKNNITTFTNNDSMTGDSTPPSLLASGETHASIFSKVSTIFKNVRWLLSKMGTTDISSIGNGTVTGALSTLNSRIVVQTFVTKGLGYNFVFIGNDGYIAAIYNNKRSLNGASVVAYTFDDATNVYDVWFDTVLNTTDSVELTVIWIKW